MEDLKEILPNVRSHFSCSDESESDELDRKGILLEAERILQEKLRKFEKEIRIKRKLQYIQMGYRNNLFADHESTTNPVVMRNAKKFIEFFETNFKSSGIYISGDYGTGKTFLASMIANEMALNHKYIVFMEHINNAITEFNNEKEYILKSLIEERKFDLMILDDFGAQRMSDYQIEQLLNLIDAIYLAKISLIVTTNIPRENLLKEPNERLRRVYDRIIEMTQPFPAMKGVSKRLSIAKKRASQSIFDWD